MDGNAVPPFWWSAREGNQDAVRDIRHLPSRARDRYQSLQIRRDGSVATGKGSKGDRRSGYGRGPRHLSAPDGGGSIERERANASWDLRKAARRRRQARRSGPASGLAEKAGGGARPKIS